MGLCAWPPSEETTKRAGPIVFMQCAMAAAVVKAHFGVMEQNTNSMRTSGRASAWTSAGRRRTPSRRMLVPSHAREAVGSHIGDHLRVVRDAREEVGRRMHV